MYNINKEDYGILNILYPNHKVVDKINRFSNKDRLILLSNREIRKDNNSKKVIGKDIIQFGTNENKFNNLNDRNGLLQYLLETNRIEEEEIKYYRDLSEDLFWEYIKIRIVIKERLHNKIEVEYNTIINLYKVLYSVDFSKKYEEYKKITYDIDTIYTGLLTMQLKANSLDKMEDISNKYRNILKEHRDKGKRFLNASIKYLSLSKEIDKEIGFMFFLYYLCK